MWLLVDGYNILHELDMIPQTVQPGQLQVARATLLDLIAEHLGPLSQRCTVVFDAAKGPSKLMRSEVHKGIEVRFSERREEADDLIEWLVKQCSTPKQLVVASSDRRLREAAQRRKATSIAADQFLEWLERQQAKRLRESNQPVSLDETSKQPPKVSQADTDELLAEFSKEKQPSTFQPRQGNKKIDTVPELPSWEDTFLNHPAQRDEAKRRATRKLPFER